MNSFGLRTSISLFRNPSSPTTSPHPQSIWTTAGSTHNESGNTHLHIKAAITGQQVHLALIFDLFSPLQLQSRYMNYLWLPGSDLYTGWVGELSGYGEPCCVSEMAPRSDRSLLKGLLPFQLSFPLSSPFLSLSPLS